MKKKLYLIFTFILCAIGMQAQVDTYSFASSAGTYTPLTSESILWSGTFDDVVSASIVIPSFTVSGVTYSNMYVSSNGFITLGTGEVPAINYYTAISGSTAYYMAIAPFAGDLMNAAAGSPRISYNTSVSGDIVVQWQDVRHFGASYTSQRISFQIRLTPSTGLIRFVYGGTINGGATALVLQQVGLRGGTNADFNNRSTSADWTATTTGSTNDASCAFSPSVTPSPGLTFSYSVCTAVSSFPYLQSFDGVAFAPACWANVNTSGPGSPGTWTQYLTGTHPSCSPHSGSAMAGFDCWDYHSGTTGFLATPQIEMTSDQYEVHFWMYRDYGVNMATDKLNVYYNVTPSTAGATLLGTVHRYYGFPPAVVTPNQWYEYVFDMPAGSSGPAFIVFEGVSQYGNNIFLDDIKVKPIFSCPPGATPEQEICGTTTNDGCHMQVPGFEPIIPGETKCGTTYVTGSNIDSDWYTFTLDTRMDVTLTGYGEFPVTVSLINPTCPQYEYISYNFGQPFTSTTTEATLDPGTYVALITPSGFFISSCEEESKYWLTLNATSCLVDGFPLKESFDETTFTPPCWRNVKESGTGMSGTWDRKTSGTFPVTCSPHSGAAMARFDSWDYPAGTKGLLITPQMSLSSDQYEVHFWMFRDDNFQNVPDSLNVYYNTSPNTTGATLLGRVYRNAGSSPVVAVANQWYEYVFSMPAGSSGNAYVVFEGVSMYGASIYIDEVEVKVIFECPAGSTAEAEPCGSDLNGGCNMSVPSFEPISPGETICGTAWADGVNQDTDWFTFTLAQKTTLNLTAMAEFPVEVGFTNSPCPQYSYTYYNMGPEGRPVSVLQTLDPGTYYVVVTPTLSNFKTIPCEDDADKYWVKMTGSYCFEPTGITVSMISGTTATLSWTSPIPSPAGGYAYEIRTAGIPGSGPAGLTVSGTTPAGVQSAYLAGLSLATTYYVYVRSNCNDGNVSMWTVASQFTTTVVPLNTVVQTVVLGGQSSCYNAIQTITVAGGGNAFVVFTGGSSTMIAGQKIDYLPGTLVVSGGYLHGMIAPNGPYCVPAPVKAVSDEEKEFPAPTGQTFFRIYPNPTTGNFTIEQKGDRAFGKIKVEIYGMRGESVMASEMINEKKRDFSLAEKPAGLYFVKVVADDYLETIKLIKTW